MWDLNGINKSLIVIATNGQKDGLDDKARKDIESHLILRVLGDFLCIDTVLDNAEVDKYAVKLLANNNGGPC